MKPMILRSASTSSADALISMKNVRPMMASCTPKRRSITRPFVSFVVSTFVAPTSVRSRQHRLFRPPVRGQRAAAFGDVRLELLPEVVQRREDRRCRGVAERTQRLADDIGGD